MQQSFVLISFILPVFLQGPPGPPGPPGPAGEKVSHTAAIGWYLLFDKYPKHAKPDFVDKVRNISPPSASSLFLFCIRVSSGYLDQQELTGRR